jgi:Domain of unknown function (DUF4062)
MKKKLQVFVSSTYTDLLAERQAVVEAILRAGHIPAGMELFAAGDESQLETIRRWIDDSDVFMLILGGRYGSIEPESGKSYVQLEYEYAIEKRKPFFAAVITDSYLEEKVKADGPLAMEKLNGHLLKSFRETVTKRISRFFEDVNGLKLIVFESLADNERYEDLPGWIRGSDAIDPKAILEEVERLQAENSSLHRQLEEFKGLLVSSASAEPQRFAASLSDDAKELLVAAKNNGGFFENMIHPSGGGDAVQVGQLINPKTLREKARWRAARDELLERGLIEKAQSLPSYDTFELNHWGYKVSDEIEAGIDDKS